MGVKFEFGSACQQCPTSVPLAPAGSTSFTACYNACDPGKALDSNDVCQDCAAGTYQPNSVHTGACINCPADSDSAAGSDALTDCECNAGREMDTVWPALTCTECAIGKFKTNNEFWKVDACPGSGDEPSPVQVNPKCDAPVDLTALCKDGTLTCTVSGQTLYGCASAPCADGFDNYEWTQLYDNDLATKIHTQSTGGTNANWYGLGFGNDVYITDVTWSSFVVGMHDRDVGGQIMVSNELLAYGSTWATEEARGFTATACGAAFPAKEAGVQNLERSCNGEATAVYVYHAQTHDGSVFSSELKVMGCVVPPTTIGATCCQQDGTPVRHNANGHCLGCSSSSPCLPVLTFWEAAQICYDIGARLCYKHELPAYNSACGTGCSTNDHHVWTVNGCEDCPAGQTSVSPFTSITNCVDCAAGKGELHGVCNDCPANTVNTESGSVFMGCECNPGYENYPLTCTECCLLYTSPSPRDS